MKRMLFWAMALLLATAACSAEPKQGVRVEGAWARATVAAAPVAGGFLTVVNTGTKDDRLLRAESGIAERVEIHEMRHEDGMMRMRALADGLAVPAGGKVELAPGGYHLMFIRPTHALTAGERFSVTLVFEHAGAIPVEFEVREMGAGSAHMQH
ncbi:copper chaperone PCu(A)C [Pseudoxanthomonas kalamensis]|uniref:copper chaperone PCu(A)C n=1 Tax=Pseudoxanthomonas kalamensis TaxID=289483 RepID=UPI001391258E|nr:copper chaperone PCu(A)C [Pseudoxanthomonas kalamensis]